VRSSLPPTTQLPLSFVLHFVLVAAKVTSLLQHPRACVLGGYVGRACVVGEYVGACVWLAGMCGRGVCVWLAGMWGLRVVLRVRGCVRVWLTGMWGRVHSGGNGLRALMVCPCL
jgi:hypothetical protein